MLIFPPLTPLQKAYPPRHTRKIAEAGKDPRARPASAILNQFKHKP
ncbi:hypothetical protein HMPREF9061_01656 [Actinomyces sp. oral taxon 181 str. F0379]|nr:hypothetical protein HMPREF9061_01656 [Actinomyces sp. oral taxon 181 str. F0379]